jgi:hypothetical protein
LGPGPDEDTDNRVEDDGPGGTDEGRAHVHQDHAEALAEPPDDQRPGEGENQCRLDSAAVDQPESDRTLHEGEQGVPKGQILPDEIGGPEDRLAHPARLHQRGRFDRFGEESMRVHERLKLKRPVEQPDQAEGDLDPPDRDPDTGDPRLERHLVLP